MALHTGCSRGLKVSPRDIREGVRHLLSWNCVQTKLGSRWGHRRGRQELPLECLRGSFSRWRDYNIDFVPHQVLSFDPEGWPWEPIEVLCLDQVGFVLDGHHRVALARQLGWKTLSAEIRQVETLCPILASMNDGQLLAQAALDRWLREEGLGQCLERHQLVLRSPLELRLLQQRRAEFETALQWWQKEFVEAGLSSLSDYLSQYFPELQKRRSWWSRFRGRRAQKGILGWA